MYMHLVNELKGSNGHLLHNPFHCLTFSVNNLLANPPKPQYNLHPWKNPLHLLPPFIQIQNMRLNHPTIFRVSFSCIRYCTYYTAREALCNWHSLGRGCFWVWLCNLGSCIGWIYLRLIVASRRIFRRILCLILRWWWCIITIISWDDLPHHSPIPLLQCWRSWSRWNTCYLKNNRPHLDHCCHRRENHDLWRCRRPTRCCGPLWPTKLAGMVEANSSYHFIYSTVRST